MAKNERCTYWLKRKKNRKLDTKAIFYWGLYAAISEKSQSNAPAKIYSIDFFDLKMSLPPNVIPHPRSERFLHSINSNNFGYTRALTSYSV